MDVSLRQVFGFETTHNFVTAKRIQYSPLTYRGWSDEDICKDFRTSMNTMLNKDNVLSVLKGETVFIKVLNRIKPFGLRKRLFHILIESATAKLLGDAFILSYWGNIELPKPLADMIADSNILLQCQPHAFPFMLESYSLNDKFVMNAHTFLKDNTLFEHMVDILKSYGIDAHIEKDYIMNDITYDNRGWKEHNLSDEIYIR